MAKLHRTREYVSYSNMHNRCYSPKNPAYKWYGNRGIKVCERWHSFKNFYEDMGDKPKGLTLERMDNDGDYEPGNCCWADMHQQRINRRPISCGPFKQRWFSALNLSTCERFESNNQKEFCKRHGLNRHDVSACLHERRNEHRKWIFRFLT